MQEGGNLVWDIITLPFLAHVAQAKALGSSGSLCDNLNRHIFEFSLALFKKTKSNETLKEGKANFIQGHCDWHRDPCNGILEQGRDWAPLQAQCRQVGLYS